MQFTMLLVLELQFEVVIQVSYKESGTMIFLSDGVLVKAEVEARVGTDVDFLKSNMVRLVQLENA